MGALTANEAIIKIKEGWDSKEELKALYEWIDKATMTKAEINKLAENEDFVVMCNIYGEFFGV